jgi:hypothetical protein
MRRRILTGESYFKFLLEYLELFKPVKVRKKIEGVFKL